MNKIISRGREYKVGDVFHAYGHHYRVQKIVDGIPYLEQQEEVQFT